MYIVYRYIYKKIINDKQWDSENFRRGNRYFYVVIKQIVFHNIGTFAVSSFNWTINHIHFHNLGVLEKLTPQYWNIKYDILFDNYLQHYYFGTQCIKSKILNYIVPKYTANSIIKFTIK